MTNPSTAFERSRVVDTGAFDTVSRQRCLRAFSNAACSDAISCFAAFSSISPSLSASLLSISCAFAAVASLSTFFARASAASLSKPAACDRWQLCHGVL